MKKFYRNRDARLISPVTESIGRRKRIARCFKAHDVSAEPTSYNEDRRRCRSHLSSLIHTIRHYARVGKTSRQCPDLRSVNRSFLRFFLQRHSASQRTATFRLQRCVTPSSFDTAAAMSQSACDVIAVIEGPTIVSSEAKELNSTGRRKIRM